MLRTASALAILLAGAAAAGEEHTLVGPVFLEHLVRTTTPIGPGGVDQGWAVAPSPDGARFYVAGSKASGGLNDDIWVQAHDTVTAALLWSATYAGAGADYDWPRDVLVSPDGAQVYVSGYEATPSGQGAVVLALDAATGAQRWVHQQAGPPGYAAGARNLVQSADGARLFTGMRAYQGGWPNWTFDGRLLAIDAASGAEVWSATPTLARDGGTVLVVDLAPDEEHVAFAGFWGKPPESGASSENQEVLVGLHDAATGAEVWSTRLDFPGDGYAHEDEAYDVEFSPDGSRVAICGKADAFPHMDFLVAVLDAATGAVVWTALYDGAAWLDQANDLAWSPGGERIFAGGFTREPGGIDVFLTVALDAADGELLWEASHAGPTDQITASNKVVRVLVTPDGARVIVTGFSSSDPAPGSVSPNPHWDYATIGYDAATGKEIWNARYDGPGIVAPLVSGNDDPRDAALSADGATLFVTGTSLSATSNDIVTAVYRLLPTATATAFGAGCPGAAATPALSAVDPPWIGKTLRLRLVDAAPSAPALLGASAGGGVLPVGPCELYLDPASMVLVPATTTASGAAVWQIPIAQDVALAGIALTAQGAVLDGGGALGWALSPGLELVLGG